MTVHAAETQKIDVRAATEIARRARLMAFNEWNSLPANQQAEPDSLGRLIRKHYRRLDRAA